MDDKKVDRLIELGNEANIQIEKPKAEKLIGYMEGLLEKNKFINLTRITEEEEFMVLHLIDSLTVLGVIKESPKKILDVGTGGGFPGIPLAIMMPDSEITLLDSTQKKLKVIHEIAQALDIENIRIIHGRAEELAHQNEYREQFDVVVSRAVANLNTLSEYCVPFIRKGGNFFAMKGKDYLSEMESGKKAIKKLGGTVTMVHKDLLLKKDYEHVIIEVKKTGQTPGNLPRNAGRMKKEPLK